MGNIMRQPAGVMSGGFWLIELLPALHTKQDQRTEDNSAATLFFSLEDISSLSALICGQDRTRWRREAKETEKGREGFRLDLHTRLCQTYQPTSFQVKSDER